jgi:quinol monooxygenase YgiN
MVIERPRIGSRRHSKSKSHFEGVCVLIYQLKIEIKPYKPDEFIDSMRSLLSSIRKEEGCLDFKLYQDSEKENAYILTAEWKTRKAMEKHFKTNEFEVLVGAARVLGETFAMNIAEVSKTGGIELAREQIASPRIAEKKTIYIQP